MVAIGNYEVVENDLGSLTPGSYTESVQTASGKVVLGGGIEVDNASVNQSYPAVDGSAWVVQFVTNSGSASAVVRATCAEMGVCS